MLALLPTRNIVRSHGIHLMKLSGVRTFTDAVMTFAETTIARSLLTKLSLNKSTIFFIVAHCIDAINARNNYDDLTSHVCVTGICTHWSWTRFKWPSGVDEMAAMVKHSRNWYHKSLVILIDTPDTNSCLLF